MRQPNAPIMVNITLPSTSTVESNPIILKQEFCVAVQAVWTGTPVGNFTIETTCDPGMIDPLDGSVSGLTNWVTYTGSTVAAGGAGGSFIWRFNDIPDAWMRLKYTAGSSTGVINARFNAKGV